MQNYIKESLNPNLETTFSQIFSMTVNERIRTFADQRGITQYRLAKDVGLSWQSINRMVKGEGQPNYQTLAGLLESYPALGRKDDANIFTRLRFDAGK